MNGQKSTWQRKRQRSNADEEQWLDCSAAPFDKVQSLLKPRPAELIAAHEFSKRYCSLATCQRICSGTAANLQTFEFDVNGVTDLFGLELTRLLVDTSHGELVANMTFLSGARIAATITQCC